MRGVFRALFVTTMSSACASLSGCTALVLFANEEALAPPDLPVRDRADAGAYVDDGGDTLLDAGRDDADAGSHVDAGVIDAGASLDAGGQSLVDAGALILTATTSMGTFPIPGTVPMPPHTLNGGESALIVTIDVDGGEITVLEASLTARTGFQFDGLTLDEVTTTVVDEANPLSLTIRFTAATFTAHGAVLHLNSSLGVIDIPVQITVARPAFLLGGAGGRRLLSDYSDDAFTEVADVTDVDLSDPEELIDRSIRGVGYGHGTFVAVGTAHVDAAPRARLLFTQDGATWNECISRFDDDIPEFDAFLTNAESGCTLPNNVPPLEDVAYGNGVFVAITADGAIQSSDAVTWTWSSEQISVVTPPSGFVPALQQIVFGGDRFVLFGGERTVSTTNGVDFAGETYHAHPVTGVAYGHANAASGPMFVAVGPPWARVTSVDGINWNAPLIEPGTQYDAVTRSVAFEDGRFIAFTANDSQISDDGVSWTQQNARGKSSLCHDEVSQTFVTFAFNYDYGVNNWRQRFYRSSTIEELGPVNPEPFATRFTINSIDGTPACGAFYAPLPSFSTTP